MIPRPGAQQCAGLTIDAQTIGGAEFGTDVALVLLDDVGGLLQPIGDGPM